jgi:DNA-binding MarR family transcriptional regulator/GNAT superfamily N-acetyltransferase
MEADLINQVRRFNRTVTRRIGALNDGYLARTRSLGQARLLWEIGTDRPQLRALRSRLGLDSGYLSRLLRTLEGDGLVELDTDPSDARIRTVRLTPAGLAEHAELNRRSDALAGSILGPLTRAQRDRLVTAMAEVERLLLASTVDITVTDPQHPDARHCLAEYFAELGARFDEGFDPSRSISAADNEIAPPDGLLLVARLYDEPVGCAAVKFHGTRPAEVKRMWVSPTVRGLGLGRRLLGAVETEARHHGTRTLRLETNHALTEAISLYRAAGYREVNPFNNEAYAHHWFEKTLETPAG